MEQAVPWILAGSSLYFRKFVIGQMKIVRICAYIIFKRYGILLGNCTNHIVGDLFKLLFSVGTDFTVFHSSKTLRVNYWYPEILLSLITVRVKKYIMKRTPFSDTSGVLIFAAPFHLSMELFSSPNWSESKQVRSANSRRKLGSYLSTFKLR